ncbi:non-ribosomal peptide synthetase [Paenibacillus durus]|uniref:Ornithine racemase n=1 Tax=Paenibacillus durus TaxID=44251 RepID=A0A089HMZ1_PAEDU|nr:non-ribosomal peptide synthetase [Paenibacillus durus]AIQ12432.1 ornithine racemase [Paenibacillus durus]
MNITELMHDLNKRNISLYHEQGKIKIIGPREQISPELREKIKLYKKEIIQFLTDSERLEKNGIPRVKPSEENCYPLSRAQKRMYILHQMDEQGVAYNIPLVMKLKGRLDIHQFEQAMQQIIQRHEGLRTAFIKLNDEPVQKIHREIHFEVPLSELGEQSITSRIRQFIKPFDLEQAPLIRAEMVKVDNDEHLMLLDMHHIISDGISMAVFMKELSVLFEGGRLVPLSVQYKDYSQWQHERERQGSLDEQEKYWLLTLSGELPQLQMPLDDVRPAVQNYEGGRILFEVNQSMTRRLKHLAEQNGVTLYMLLMAAYTVLLSKYTGQKDLIVGTPIAGRPHDELKPIIGLFTNTLATRHYPESDLIFTQYLNHVRTHILSVFENQDYPFDMLVESLNLPINRSRNPVFDTMFDLQYASDFQFKLGDLKAESCNIDFPVAKFDIGLTVIHYGEYIQMDLQYASKLFNAETMERFSGHFLNILNEIVDRPEKTLDEIRIMSPEEESQVTYQFNSHKVIYQESRTLNDLLEERAEITPERVAVVHGDHSLTYRELNNKANQLARRLRIEGVKPNTVVGIMVERSIEMIVGIMGILKAGGAYLPLNPELPGERISYMLADSNAILLVTEETFKSQMNFSPCITFDDGLIDTMEKTNPERVNHASDLAYLIYTSGSTGMPKGVMTTHKNVMNYIHAFLDQIPLTEEDTILQVVSFSFDAFTEEVFPLLTVSGRILISGTLTETHVDELVKQIERQNVTIVSCSPLLLNELDKNKHLRLHTGMRFISGGDVLKAEYIKNIITTAQVFNSYGPTEATVCATYHRVSQVDLTRKSIPIGRPLGNYQVYVLDENKHVLPIGIPGELYIGGAGVASGYLNNPEMTGSKFMEHLYLSGERMYRTGDLGRWLPDGSIEFLGRTDYQVKIRGYRVEVQEVEHHLLSHPAVKDVIVAPRQDSDGNNFLCAYVVLADSQDQTAVQKVKMYAAKVLPGYMVPSCFVPVEQIPRTINGKTDWKALPVPVLDGMTLAEYAAPRNGAEQKLVRIWEEVLGVGSIGIDHHFFELGGQSLKAFAMMTALQRVFQVHISLKDIFSHATIRQLGEYIRSVDKQDCSSIKKAEEKPYYSLSAAQKRIYILNQIQQPSIMYNMPLVIRISGEVHHGLLEQAFHTLIQRHEVLRTSFVEINGEPVQQIEQTIAFRLRSSMVNSDELERRIQTFIQPFDLREAPLLRAELLKEEQDHLLLLDMHHIISDGVSMDILTNELGQLYEGNKLPPVAIQYKDYSEWSLTAERNRELKRQEQYWLQALGKDLPVLQLQTDYARPAVQSSEGGRISVELGEELTKKLRIMAADSGTTMFMLLLAAYTALLARYTAQEDIIVGTPIAGRQHQDLSHTMGMFVNTLALRNYPRPELNFQQYLHQVKETTINGFEHQEYPFDELVGQLGLDRDVSRNALFDTMFSLQDEQQTGFNAEGLQAELYPFEYPIAKFDLSVTALESSNLIRIYFGYATKLFKQETIERMGRHLTKILQEIVRQPECPLGEINLVSDEERQMLLHVFNDTAREYPRDQAVPQFIEDQAHRRPDHTAVVFEGEQLTYRELNEQADRVAQLLRARGVRRETPVGIMIDRSLEMVTGLLGILKSGGAYLPLDPAFPEERIRYMLEDSGAKLVVTQGHLVNKVGEASMDCETLVIDDSILTMQTVQEASAQTSAAANKVDHDPQDLAYIIYTSGSTGLPKGVLVEHGAFANFCHGFSDLHQITEQDHVGNYLQITFDGSIIEIFPALMMGATLHVIPADLRLDMDRLNRYMNEQSITLVTLPPKVCEAFIGQPNESLRLLIAGGEQLKLSTLPHYPVVNAYGPTENTVVTTSQLIDRAGGNIPIGKPVPNTRIYILNRSRQLCPVGVTGELYIAGDSLARGYLNNAVQTAEKFVDNPYEPGGRMYRTGDLARWLPDGSLVFMGRADQQVKIRGYRIEPGEVEQQLLKHPAIREAVVIAHEDRQGVSSLCAYLISDDVWTTTAVRELLEAELPEYMIPAYVIQLEQLPLTSHGKLDRKSLPEPDQSLRSGPDYEAPRNEVEEKLVSVWREVLGIEDIGINHQFFVSGGDSIKALQIGSRLAKAGLRLEVKDLFAHPKIKDLSSYVKVEQRERRTEESVEGEVEYTPIQQWFFQQNREERNHFTQSFMLHRAEGFEASRIEQVFDQLLAHHDALRMIYAEQDGEIRQINRRAGERMFSLHRYDVRGMDDQERQVYEIATKIQQASAIEEGKLVQVGLFRAEDGDHLLIAIHHLVVDGVSWRILLEDFELLYRQAEQDAPLDIGFKTDSYQRFAGELKEYALGKQVEKERAYWTELAAVKTRFIPGQVVPEPDTFANSRTIQSSLREETTLQLLRESNRAYQTEINDLLLSALYVAVRELTGEQRLKVNLEGHGREDVLEGMDVSRTVGWFTTMYPVVLEGEEQDELSKTIKRIKEGLRKVPNKGIGYGVLKYLTRVPELQNEERAPILFNYLGEIGGTAHDGLFGGSRFSLGESIGGKIIRSNPVEINAVIVNGRLMMSTTYNASEYSEAIISRFNNMYVDALEQIIAHCANKEYAEKTSSDYGYSDLSLEDLEELLSEYEVVED